MGAAGVLWEHEARNVFAAAASERTTVAESWIKRRLLCQVAGFVPPVAESSLCFLTSGHRLQLEDSSNAQVFGSGLAQAQGDSGMFVPDCNASTSAAPQPTDVSTFIRLLRCGVVSQLTELG